MVRCFFFDFAKRTKQQFPRIFGADTDGLEEQDARFDDGLKQVLGRYGFYHMFMEACERDLTKLDLISEKKAWELFTYMNYMLDYNYVTNTIIKRTYQ